MSVNKNDKVDVKVHTGFRLSKNNYKLLEDLEKDLGINKSSIVNMILSIIKKDKSVIIDLIKTAISK